MRILFSAETLYPILGGADVSARTLLEELAKKHEVHAVYLGKPFKTNITLHPLRLKKEKGIWARAFYLNKRYKRVLENKIRLIRPDLIITQGILTPSTIELAKKYKIKSVTFIRNYFHMCLNGFKTKTPEKCNKSCLFCKTEPKYKLQYPFFKIVRKQQVKALRNTNLIMPVSHYVKNLTKKWYGLNSEVIRPFIETKKYKVKKGEYITLINPDKHKGLGIFKQIIRRFPNKKFLIVGKKFPESRNVKNIRWADDMREAYKLTRILLVPSIWPDPCPRVTIEAMTSGIPCIGTNIGGFPEEVEDSGVVIKNLNNINEWVNAIKALDDKKLYSKLSKKAVKQAEKFDFKTQFKKINELLSSL